MNRLNTSASPYLLQHADNPVDWWPWSDEAFAEAKRRDVPVLLSVGYAACHWCHVMAHESFEDEATAAIVNGSVVAIKVDREERPDIDAVYMSATMPETRKQPERPPCSRCRQSPRLLACRRSRQHAQPAPVPAARRPPRAPA